MGRLEVLVAVTALAAAGDHDGLAHALEVAEHEPAVAVADDRADGDVDDEVFGTFSAASSCGSVY